MQILKLNFLFYTMSGLWRPVHWTSKRSKILYNMFTFIVLYLFTFMFLGHLMYIIFVVESLDHLASCLFFVLASISLWTKAITLIIRRDEIINLIEIIEGEPCKPSDEEEINIQTTYDRAIRSYSMPYIILCMSSSISCVGGGIAYTLSGIIPFGCVWVPWDCSSNFIYVITCMQSIASILFGVFPNLATETTVMGFCVQVCARFEILKHRIQKVMKQRGKEGLVINSSNKTNVLSEHVSHHLRIIRLAEMINEVFNHIIFAQFSTSILIICTLGYYMLTHFTLLDTLTLGSYFCCTFLQIFYYCWGGNEVILKSTEFGSEIYNMDWTFMTNSEQKDLLIIMKRSTRPIKFSSSFLVTLSLESYTNLLKASFSAFNLMKQF